MYHFDKIQHVTVSAGITLATVYVLKRHCQCDWPTTAALVLMMFIPISITKEYFDSQDMYNWFDVFDIVANYTGVVLMLLGLYYRKPAWLSPSRH